MPEDYFDSNASGGMDAGGDGDGMDKPEQTKSEDDKEGQTGLLPKAVFPEEPKVGDICDFKVTRIYDDQVEVEYNRSEEGKPDDSGGEPAPAEVPSGMSSMMG